MASELGVQTIQHTNGTDAMTIDSSGIITSSAGFANSATATFSSSSNIILLTSNGIPSWANEIMFLFVVVSWIMWQTVTTFI